MKIFGFVIERRNLQIELSNLLCESNAKDKEIEFLKLCVSDSSSTRNYLEKRNQELVDSFLSLRNRCNDLELKLNVADNMVHTLN